MVDLNLRRAKLSPNEKLTVNKFPFNFVLFCWFGFGFVLGIFGFFCHELRLIWNDFCCCCCCRCRLVNCMQHLTEKQPKKEIKKWIVRPSFGWGGKVGGGKRHPPSYLLFSQHPKAFTVQNKSTCVPQRCGWKCFYIFLTVAAKKIVSQCPNNISG